MATPVEGWDEQAHRLNKQVVIDDFTGVGFEGRTGYEPLLGLDLDEPPDGQAPIPMQGINASVYIRVPFEVNINESAFIYTSGITVGSFPDHHLGIRQSTFLRTNALVLKTSRSSLANGHG